MERIDVVFVLDRNGKPLMPCSEKRARLLLERNRARVHRLVPFAIRLVDRKQSHCELQPLAIKLDPGSKITGIALVRNNEIIDVETGEIKTEAVVLNLFELVHRGRQISEALTGYETREYLLEKFGRQCCYCGATDVPLNIEHIHPRAKGGTNRLSNLAIACIPCNTKKGTRSIEDFLAHNPARLAKIKAQIKRPLKDAAAVNATRWALFNALKATGLAVNTGTGGQTKYNRYRLGLPKTHALDAAVVGRIDAIRGWIKPMLTIKCTGRGSYQRTRLDAYGFPRGYLARQKSVKGFRTGDMVMATVPTGKKAGIHVGRVAVRATGSFNIQKHGEVVQGISYKHCRVLQRGDGFGYSRSIANLNPGKGNFPVSSHNLPSRSRVEVAALPCG